MTIWKAKWIRCTFLVLICLNLLFAPRYSVFPKWTWIASLMGFLCLLDKDFRTKFRIISRKTIFFTLLILSGVFLSLLYPVLHSTKDFSYAQLQVAILLNAFRGILIVYIVYQLERFPDAKSYMSLYIRVLALSCVVYVAITGVFAIFPSVKQFWLTSVIDYEYFHGEAYGAYVFRYGIDGFAAFSSSTIFSIVILLFTYEMLEKFHIGDLLIYLVLALGCLLYGRIAFVGIVLSLFMMLLTIRSNSAAKKYMLSIGILGGLGVATMFLLSQTNVKIQAWFNWSFGVFGQLFSSGKISDHSVVHMFEDMYYIPSIKTILIGDGWYMNLDGSYYGHTDVGFMRSLLFWGILGTVLNYSLTVYTGVSIYKRFRSVDVNMALCRLMLLMGALLIILEMKGEAFQRIIQVMFPILLLSGFTERGFQEKLQIFSILKKRRVDSND